MRPSLYSFLGSIGVQPKRSLSQNFLTDQNILRKIVEAAEIESGETVLEIGPGPGVLTEALLHQGARVIAVEKDSLLAEALSRFQTEDHRLQVFEQDILDFSFETLPPCTKVVANLPYHITTPILTKLVPHHERFSRLVVMVQDEVARRFTADPGSKEFGSITLFLSYFSDVAYCFPVSRHCFYPKPRVNSAVVAFDLHPPSHPIEEEFLFQIIRTAFQQRRKMVRSTLQAMFSREKIEKCLDACGLNVNVRPEEMGLDIWIALARRFRDYV